MDGLLPKRAVVCDLDGTLCDLHGRDPYKPQTCSEDTVSPNVLRLLQAFASDHTIAYVSGRWESARSDTLAWLATNRAPDGMVFLRPEGDYTPSDVLKAKVSQTLAEGGYKVTLALDDFTRNVQMWRSLGIECWQVAASYDEPVNIEDVPGAEKLYRQMLRAYQGNSEEGPQ